MSGLEIAGLLASAAAAGLINAVAGGGTLITFPTLLAFGTAAKVANATSTFALVIGTFGGVFGYRRQLAAVKPWLWRFIPPSILGGWIGAKLLDYTSDRVFSKLVPFLILFATVLFVSQGLIKKIMGSRGGAAGTGVIWAAIVFHFAVSIYGGYFGAGIGILMLAALGLMGFSNIHRMNGLKNWGGFCMNLVAALSFALSGIVRWPVALGMALGSVAGGYIGARAALKVPQEVVRGAVAAVGVLSGVWLLLRLRL